MDPTSAAVLAARSAQTLGRLEGDHPRVTQLRVTMMGTMDGQFWPANSDDLSKLGDAIGRNTRLERMEVHFWTAELAEQIMGSQAFFDGIGRNRSIRKLSLFHCIFEGAQCDILDRLVDRVRDLEELVIFGASLENGGVKRVMSAVAACESLGGFSVINSNAGDGIVSEITSGLGGLRHLCSLDLSMNVFGREGVGALGTLLKDPSCNLTHLVLGNNRIDDESVEILAASLKGNKKVVKVGLGRNNLITERGWAAFAEILCSAESLDGTYFSNHALCDLQRWDLPEELASLLSLNEGADKKKIALHKTLRHHSLPHMRAFLEWDLKMLPVAVGWFNDKGQHVEDEAAMRARKLTAIYQFARALPLMIVPPQGSVIVRAPGDASTPLGSTVIQRLLPLLLAFWRWVLSFTQFPQQRGIDGAARVESPKPSVKRSVLMTDLGYGVNENGPHGPNPWPRRRRW